MPKLDTEADVLDELKRYDRLLDAVLDELKQKGLEMPPAPVNEEGDPYVPQWPAHITKLDDPKLFALHGEFEEFLRHIAGQEVISRQEKRIAHEKTALVKAAIRKRSSGKNKEERDDSTTLDVLFQKMRQEELYFTAFHNIHEAMQSIFDDDVSAISRQMTQREKALEHGRRGGGAAKRPWKPK
jgi:hypothetical protein